MNAVLGMPGVFTFTRKYVTACRSIQMGEGVHEQIRKKKGSIQCWTDPCSTDLAIIRKSPRQLHILAL